METTQLEINFPLFEGFYSSDLDLTENISVGESEEYSMTEKQFEEIDWETTHNNIAKFYLEYIDCKLKKFFNEIGIIKLNFIKVDSPRFYNYSTDKLVCNIEVDKNKFLTELQKHDFNAWENFLLEEFSSRDGFISFYPNNPIEWAGIINEKFDTDNVVIETLLQFYLEENGEIYEVKKELLNYEINEKMYEFLEY